MSPFSFPIPDSVLDELADRVAERVRDQREYLTLDEAAAYLKLTRAQLRARTHASPNARVPQHREPIPFRRDGKRYLFVRAEIDAWLDRGGGELD